MELVSKSNVAHLNKDLKLNGQNYDVWSKKIQYLLQEQEALDALSSVMVQPEEGTTSQHRMDLEAYVAWRKKNYTARVILLSAMEDDIAKQFNIYENATDLWVILKRNFGGVSLTKLRSMTIYFDSYKKHPDHTMKMHLREMFKMICELRDAGHKMTEEHKVQAVIRSLPNSWDHMKMFLIHNKNIRTFEDVARHLELEEDRLTSIKMNVFSHFAGTTSSIGNSTSNNINVNKRRWFGETQNQEPKKPKQEQEGGNKLSEKKVRKVKISRVKCFNCQGKGHYAQDCTVPKVERTNDEGSRSLQTNSSTVMICKQQN